jgi:hypothetical protein
MAIRSSVTVSIGEERKGVLRVIFLVTLKKGQLACPQISSHDSTYLVCRETMEAGKEMCPGSIKKSL